MRICIDLDGTICALCTDGKYADVAPMPGAAEALRRLKAAGHHVIIYTARRMRTHQGDVEKVKADIGQLTVDWLARHGIPYDELIFGKPYAHVYVDDLALRFDQWPTVEKELEALALRR